MRISLHTFTQTADVSFYFLVIFQTLPWTKHQSVAVWPTKDCFTALKWAGCTCQGIHEDNSGNLPPKKCWLIVSTHLKNMKVNWDYYSQYMEKHVPNHHPECCCTLSKHREEQIAGWFATMSSLIETHWADLACWDGTSGNMLGWCHWTPHKSGCFHKRFHGYFRPQSSFLPRLQSWSSSYCGLIIFQYGTLGFSCFIFGTSEFGVFLVQNRKQVSSASSLRSIWSYVDVWCMRDHYTEMIRCNQL